MIFTIFTFHSKSMYPLKCPKAKVSNLVFNISNKVKSTLLLILLIVVISLNTPLEKNNVPEINKKINGTITLLPFTLYYYQSEINI